jgi:DNA primase
VVALLGSSLSEEQEDLLCRYFKLALLLFDGDEAGRSATDDCLQRLDRRLWVKAISLPDSVQPDRMSSEEIQMMLVSL